MSASRDRDYWYDMNKVATETGTLAEDAAFWPAMDGRSLSGYERSLVLVNRSDATHIRFVDAAEAVGADDLLDGRAVAFADLWNRGALDVVIANQEGPLLVYKNTVDPARHWIRFALSSATKNRSAIGAQVSLTCNGRTQVQVVQAGSGFCSQNDLRLHFGLGSATRVERALIRWPSGAEEIVAAPRVDADNEVRGP